MLYIRYLLQGLAYGEDIINAGNFISNTNSIRTISVLLRSVISPFSWRRATY